MNKLKTNFVIFFVFIILTISSCSRKKTVSIKVPSHNKEQIAQNEEIHITFTELSPTTVAYKNSLAIAYAKKYAGLQQNSCGKFFNDANNSDCSHFIAHCLNAGGIKISNANPNLNLCPDGLVFRNVDLVDALNKLATQYQNVRKIDKNDAIVGDYLFLFNVIKFRVSHAMMVCEPAGNIKEYKVYGHTANRSCEVADPSVVQFYDAAYNITDGK